MGIPVGVSQRSAISGGSGAPATATARRDVAAGSGWLSIRITLVGTPTITVALDLIAVPTQCSGVQWGSCSMTRDAPVRKQ